MGELKPCPFCGEPDGEKITHRSRQFHIVSCASCGAHGPVPVLASGETAESVWNRRPNPQPVTPAGGEVVAYRYVADEVVYNPFVRDWLDGSPDRLDLDNIARHPGVRFEFAYYNPPVPDHELQQKWFRRGWDMYVEIHGETHSPAADAALVDLIDEALEQMELHGMHALREYKELKARHRLMDDALNQRGGGICK